MTFFFKNSKTKQDKALSQNFQSEECSMLALSCLNQSGFPTKSGVSGWLTKMSNRCLLSGRGVSVLSKFRLSRHAFRKNALWGQLPGIKKAIW